MFEIVIMPKAEEDLRSNAQWWAGNRDASQAERWYDEIVAKIYSLCDSPFRCRIAPESKLIGRQIHQLLFGISGRLTHRILFEIVDDRVNVLRVRHTSQAVISKSSEI